jgi:hypothetical protein
VTGTVFQFSACWDCGHSCRRRKLAEAGFALTRHDLEAKVVKHCWEDEAFRKGIHL